MRYDEYPKVKKVVDKRLFIIPGWLDTIESCLKNVATTMIAQSVVQMLRSTIFVYCALLALFFLKKKLYRHHWSSMCAIVTGVILVGVGYIRNDKGSDDHSTGEIIIGLVLLQVGQIVGGLAYVAEEKFLGD